MTRERAIELVQQAILEHEYQVSNTYELTDTFESIGADSLDIVEMMMIIEEKLGIEFHPADLTIVRTVEDAVRFVQRYD